MGEERHVGRSVLLGKGNDGIISLWGIYFDRITP